MAFLLEILPSHDASSEPFPKKWVQSIGRKRQMSSEMFFAFSPASLYGGLATFSNGAAVTGESLVNVSKISPQMGAPSQLS